jgi:heme A synthase
MKRRYLFLAWTAAACTYLLIVLGAIVRITGSGMGCGDHWPLCNGRLFPPLDDIGTVIEWSHRLVAALVSVLVVGLAAYAWWLRRQQLRSVNPGLAPGVREPSRLPFVALGLLVVQVLLGAITVKLELPPWSVILHLGTAMLLLATLLVAAGSHPSSLVAAREGVIGTRGDNVGAQHAAPLQTSILVLAFVTVLFGALTANLGASFACSGFPLCNGQLWPSGGTQVHIHWLHRLLAYALAVTVVLWAMRTPGRGPRMVLGIVILQVVIGAATVLLGLPGGLQAAHVAVGTAVWGGVVLAVSQQKAPGAGSTPGASVRSFHTNQGTITRTESRRPPP